MLRLLKWINRGFLSRGLHLRRVARISWHRTGLAWLSHRQGLRVLIYAGTSFSNRGTISVAPGCLLTVNEPWFFAAAEPGSLIISPGGMLALAQGHFSIKSRAFIEVKDGARLTIKGGGGYASRGVQIECTDSIAIGSGAAIGPDVIIRDSDGHPLTDPLHRRSAPVVIGDRVWIGARAMILKGVTMGDGAIVAAGAVVTQDVPVRCVVAGVPARVVRRDVSWT